MSSGVLGAIIAVAGAVTSLVAVFKWVAWKTSSTPEQDKQKIDDKIRDERMEAERTGRPV